MKEMGNIGISAENIFPIVKKFLYSNEEIFLRELISNSVDAMQKLKHLSSINKYSGKIDSKIKVLINKDAKTITFSDNGIGMTKEEVKKYINQVAFSGAKDFLEKNQNNKNDMIGFFGLGFYSSFMVSDKVEIVTKSYKDSVPVHWECVGTTSFQISETKKDSIGTDVILHISKDSRKFLNEDEISNLLNKYCKFLPIPIEFNNIIINNIFPIWNSLSSNLTNKDYIKFYKELYPLNDDPIFWIHLNIDYPFDLKGILYFPKIKDNFEQYKNQIKIYSKQVFVTDEVKDIVPDFLILLHGIIDSSEIPLNVSRSFLQVDKNVKKINNYIVKKVSDKLEELFIKDRKNYEKKWKDIESFVKYGIITNVKFYDKFKDFILLKNLDDSYFTIEEYKKKIQDKQIDKNNNLIILYTKESQKQNIYIESCKKRGYDIVKFENSIDNHLINFLESKIEKVKIKNVDSDIVDKLINKNVNKDNFLSINQKDLLINIYKKAIKNENVIFSIASMNLENMPLVITIPELMGRMQVFQNSSSLPTQLNAVINENHPLSIKILNTQNQELQISLAIQSYDLSMLSKNILNGKSLVNFINRSIKFIL